MHQGPEGTEAKTKVDLSRRGWSPECRRDRSSELRRSTWTSCHTAGASVSTRRQDALDDRALGDRGRESFRNLPVESAPWLQGRGKGFGGRGAKAGGAPRHSFSGSSDQHPT